MAGPISKRLDVVVVGAGQAGLAIGYFLAQQGPISRFLTRRRSRPPPGVGAGTRSSCSPPPATTRCPGLTFPGDPDRYPTRDEVADYLTDYAHRFELPVELNSRVRSIRKAAQGYLVELDDRAYEADQVVVATGPFQAPLVPAIAEQLDEAVVQLHSTAYRSPESIPEGPRARRRWRQHRLPDRRGALGVARGAPLDRLAPDAAAADASSAATSSGISTRPA